MFKLSPLHILASLDSADHDWPALVGTKWTSIESQYRVLRSQLENDSDTIQMRAAAELVQLLAPYDAARDRLKYEIALQTEAGSMLRNLADVADQIGVGQALSNQIRSLSPQSSNSQRYIKQKSPTKATSIKLGNIAIYFESGIFFDFLAGLVATSLKDVIGAENKVLLAAGTLVMIKSLHKVLSIKLDECEATVVVGN